MLLLSLLLVALAAGADTMDTIPFRFAAPKALPPATGQSRLRAMVYNLWNYNDGDDWAGRQRAILDVIRKAEFPHVLVLNEVRRSLASGAPAASGRRQRTRRTRAHDGTGSMYSDMKRLLEPHGYDGFYTAAMSYPEQEPEPVEEGIAVFSRLRIHREGIKVHHLAHDEELENLDANARVCVRVPVELGGGRRLDVLATHFSYAWRMQTQNALAVLRFADTTRGAGAGGDAARPQVLMGDFNVMSDLDGGEDSIQILTNPARQYVTLGEADPFMDGWVEHISRRGSGGGGDSDGVQRSGNTFCNCKMRQEDAEHCSKIGLYRRTDRILSRGLVLSKVELGPVGPQPDRRRESPDGQLICPSDHRAVIAEYEYGVA